MKRTVIACIVLASVLFAGCPPADDGDLSIDPLAVRNVTMSRAEHYMLTGSEFLLMAVITPSTAANQNVAWASDTPAVASVSGSGNTATVKAVSAGEAVITAVAASGGRTAQCRVIVSDVPVPLESIELNADDLFLVVTEPAFILRATPVPYYANVGNELAWTAAPAGIVNIVKTDNLVAEITALAAGDAIITITNGEGVTTACPVRVATESFNPDVTNVTLRVGRSVQLNTIFRPARLFLESQIQGITWVSDTGAVTVSPYGAGADSLWATVTGVAEGTATITLTAALAGGKTLISDANVTVLPAWNIDPGASWFFEDFENYRFTSRAPESADGSYPFNQTNYFDAPLPEPENFQHDIRQEMNFWNTVYGEVSYDGAWRTIRQHVNMEDLRPGTEALGGAGNKVAWYYGVGTGSRQIHHNFKNIIGGNKVYVDFDWYPGAPGLQHGFITLIDRHIDEPTLSVDFDTQGVPDGTDKAVNKIITFTANNLDQMFYAVGNVNEVTTSAASTGISGGTLIFEDVESKSQWFNIKAEIDFVSKTINLQLTDLETGNVVTVPNVPFAGGISYNPQVACLRLWAGRNDQAGWSTYLDNVYVGTAPRPAN